MQGLAALLATAVMGLSVLCDRQGPAPDPALVVDPNTAPRAVLLALPGLGPVLVDRIIEGRQAGRYTSLHDLDVRVRGIGPATVNALRPFLRIDDAGSP
jgi:competence protein ComEA